MVGKSGEIIRGGEVGDRGGLSCVVARKSRALRFGLLYLQSVEVFDEGRVVGATDGNGSRTPSSFSTGVMIWTRVRHGPRGRDMSYGMVRVWRESRKGEKKRETERNGRGRGRERSMTLNNTKIQLITKGAVTSHLEAENTQKIELRWSRETRR